MTSSTWDGKTLLEGPLAMVVPEQDPVAGRDRGLIASIVVASADHAVILEHSVLGDFLERHGRAEIACFDVVTTFDRMESLFRGRCDDRGVELLWDLARSCRLHDIGVLCQLMELATVGITSKPGSLEQILEVSNTYRSVIQRRGILDGSGTSAVPRGSVASAVGSPSLMTARSILDAYLVLRVAAAAVADMCQIDESLAEKFGPLSAGLQSQGAIALIRLGRRGLRLRADAIQQLDEACERTHRECSKRLLANSAARKAFHQEGGVVAREAGSGYPRQKTGDLRDWLQAELYRTSGVFDIPPEPPLTPKGEISIVPEFWGDLTRRRRPLGDWAELWSAAKVKESLDRSRPRGDGKVRPSYELFPRLMSRNPALEGFHGLGVERPFEPEPGKTFLIGKLEGLLLRAFAQLDVQLLRGSLISHEFDFQANPIEALAARLYSRAAARRGGLVEDVAGPAVGAHFLDLDEFSPEGVRWRQIAGGILDAVLLRMDASAARIALDKDFGIVLDASSVGRLWDDVVEIHSNLLRSHGEDSTVEFACQALGCEEFELESALGVVPKQYLRELLRGKRNDQGVFALVAGLCRDEQLEEWLRDGVGSPELYRRIFEGRAATGTGRVRCGTFLSTFNYDGLPDMVEDVIKAVLFGVVAAGFDLVGWAGPEFAIQVDEIGDVPTEAMRLKETAQLAAALVLDRYPPPCQVVSATGW